VIDLVSSLHCSIRTRRLHLRPCTRADGPALFGLMSDPRTVGEGCAPHASLSQSLSLAEALASDPDVARAWLVQRDGNLIGLVCVYEVESMVGQLAFFIDVACQGQGYGGEAVAAVIGYARAIWRLGGLWARTGAENTAACALLSRQGFVREGGARGAAIFRRRLDVPDDQPQPPGSFSE